MWVSHHPNATVLTVILTCSVVSVALPSSASYRLSASLSPSEETKNSPIVDGSNVTLEYQVTVLGDSGINYEDVSEFVQGSHEVFPALEREIAGMRPGEEKKVELTPEEGFGRRDERKKIKISRTELPPEAKAGDVVQNDTGAFATVAAVSGATAVLDYNHPLAGKPLLIQLRIIKVVSDPKISRQRAASPSKFRTSYTFTEATIWHTAARW